MASRRVEFESADTPGRVVTVDADPQTAVTPGDRPGTAIITGPVGQPVRVVGDYRDVHVKIQAAAAAAHEAGPTAG
jgi:hypothetical protein